MIRPAMTLLVTTIALMSGACASTGAVPRPFPTPGATASGGTDEIAPPTGANDRAHPAPADESRTAAAPMRAAPPAGALALTETALALRGRPYRNGGTSPNGFDCSGFTQYVFGRHGLSLPREVRDQWSAGTAVEGSEIAPGDLLFFTTVERGASHVGISLGGDEFVHAPSSTGVVRVERVSSSYWARRFVGARRITTPRPLTGRN